MPACTVHELRLPTVHSMINKPVDIIGIVSYTSVAWYAKTIITPQEYAVRLLRIFGHECKRAYWTAASCSHDTILQGWTTAVITGA